MIRIPPTIENSAGPADQAAANDYDGFAEAYAVETEADLINRVYLLPVTFLARWLPYRHEESRSRRSGLVTPGAGRQDGSPVSRTTTKQDRPRRPSPSRSLPARRGHALDPGSGGHDRTPGASGGR
ncbi:hypothetical protein [Streptosporangium lutulentum]|uniref:Uncharacterized protein n=1 Tax=Streptosporangium lutulentum TaxID=1461250 RepID=A0ABT9QA90_9ACTN|nr:hypothetical protein [Streptosporangium lutulentum]MDP9843675.1 hypothetical protein [Streptosporangium lutulentum]